MPDLFMRRGSFAITSLTCYYFATNKANFLSGVELLNLHFTMASCPSRTMRKAQIFPLTVLDVAFANSVPRGRQRVPRLRGLQQELKALGEHRKKTLDQRSPMRMKIV